MKVEPITEAAALQHEQLNDAPEKPVTAGDEVFDVNTMATGHTTATILEQAGLAPVPEASSSSTAPQELTLEQAADNRIAFNEMRPGVKEEEMIEERKMLRILLESLLIIL